MLVCCNLFISMTSLIVSLQMRARARQIHALLKKRQSFTWLTKHISKYVTILLLMSRLPSCSESKSKAVYNNRYPNFTPEVEDEDDNCAICWDLIASQNSKLLPCKHTFHTSCLKKWLLISMNCPTCRFSLLSEAECKKKAERRGRRSRESRPEYVAPPEGFWGFLHTGETLLDLFGGWDPQEEATSEVTPPPRSVSLFGDFMIQDWTVEVIL